jgi:hypothetical protein
MVAGLRWVSPVLQLPSAFSQPLFLACLPLFRSFPPASVEYAAHSSSKRLGLNLQSGF